MLDTLRGDWRFEALAQKVFAPKKAAARFAAIPAMNLPSVLAELKRRNVYKLAITYATVG